MHTPTHTRTRVRAHTLAQHKRTHRNKVVRSKESDFKWPTYQLQPHGPRVCMRTQPRACVCVRACEGACVCTARAMTAIATTYSLLRPNTTATASPCREPFEMLLSACNHREVSFPKPGDRRTATVQTLLKWCGWKGWLDRFSMKMLQVGTHTCAHLSVPEFGPRTPWRTNQQTNLPSPE